MRMGLYFFRRVREHRVGEAVRCSPAMLPSEDLHRKLKYKGICGERSDNMGGRAGDCQRSSDGEIWVRKGKDGVKDRDIINTLSI